jgi:hypothetical protein
MVAISASGAQSPEDTDYARNAHHGEGASRRIAAAGNLDQARRARRLWIPDSKVWRGPRRWQPLTRFAEPRDRELRRIQNEPAHNQNVHDNHVQATLKESGSATILLIDPPGGGSAKRKYRCQPSRVGDHLSGAVGKHYAVSKGQ